MEDFNETLSINIDCSACPLTLQDCSDGRVRARVDLEECAEHCELQDLSKVAVSGSDLLHFKRESETTELELRSWRFNFSF